MNNAQFRCVFSTNMLKTAKNWQLFLEKSSIIDIWQNQPLWDYTFSVYILAKIMFTGIQSIFRALSKVHDGAFLQDLRKFEQIGSKVLKKFH